MWNSGDVVVGGIQLHYTRTGGGGPPVVLSHGYSDNGLCWTRVARVLEREYDVVMYDARGHGSSDKPDEGYATEDHARDLIGLIGALGLDRPAAIGHSMGASTVAAVAATETLRCAVLEDPGWRDAPTAPPSEADREAYRIRQAEMREMTVQQVADMGRKQSPTWHEDEFAAWAESKLQVSPNAGRGMRAGRPDWRETAKAIRVPTLLVAPDGTRPGLVTPEVVDEAPKVQPLVAAVTISGTGHNIRRENFDDFLAAVRPFLSEHLR